MRRLAIFLLCAACGRDGGAEDGGTLKKIQEAGKITIGIELGFEPFEGLDKEGNYVGFDIDLARAYAGDLEVEAKFVPMEWTALQTALKTGQIDIIWSGMTATVARSKTILFSDTYFRTQLHLLVRADSGIKSWKDARGKKLAVKMGTTGVEVANRDFPTSEQVTFDDENLCATEVINGRAAAFLYDHFSIARHHQPGVTRVIKDLQSFEPYAVAMRPGDHALWRSINLFLERVRWDDRYATIHARHFGTPPADDRR